MKNLKTVKEVSQLTGLSRKLLHDYDKQGIVRPTQYKTRGYEDEKGNKYDGYKLYDEAAVLKLQQIAIFRELDLSRAEIKGKITAKDYDSNKVLEEQIELLKEKKAKIQNLIEMAEQLKLVGIKNKVLTFFKGQNSDVMAENRRKFEESNYYEVVTELLENTPSEFEVALEKGILKLASIEMTEYESEYAMNVMQEIFEVVTSYWGFFGYMFLIMLALSIEGEGELAKEMEITATEALIIKNYFQREHEKFEQDLVELVVKHYDVIGKEFEDESVTTLVEDAKEVYKKYFGLSKKEEYEMLFNYVETNLYSEDVSYINYILAAVKYHTS